MSNQTPDRSHASGTFVPVVALPFTTPIVNSKSIKSFVRNSAGNYTVGLVNGLAFAEGNAEAALPANFLGLAGATIAPDGLSVLVTVFNLSGVPVDPPTFGLEVRSIEEGEGKGPQPALPAVPTPPSGGGLVLGWISSTATGSGPPAVFTQSASGIVLSVSPWAGIPGVQTIVLQPGTVMGAVVASQDIGAGPTLGGTPIAELVSPTSFQVTAGTGPTNSTDYTAAIMGL